MLKHNDPGVIYSPLPEKLPGRSLTLVKGACEVSGDRGWFGEFPDEEITLSLHRWSWLLRGVTDDPVAMSGDQGLALMRSWIRQCLDAPDFAADAYSTGERIVNGSLFLLLASEQEMPSDLTAAFKRMGRQVAENLEYHRSGQTGNHAFNNARALLFAGLVAKLPGAVDLAIAISKERLPKLVTSDGFLREGSSHYQFLFTRWVLEMLWIATREGHEAFVQLLTPYAGLLVQRCWFFLIQGETDGRWRIPLIGDVSPDFPPDWLLSLPWSTLACGIHRPDKLPQPPPQRGWKDLFGAVEGYGTSAPDEVSSFPESGWFRITHRPWTVFVRAQSHRGGSEASHSHHDLGSFELFCDGAKILADGGRLDYTCSPLSLYGKSALSHNTLLIDGLGPTCDGPSWLADRYRAVQVDTEVIQSGESRCITIKHDGFMRFAGDPIFHQRRIRLTRDGCWIEDWLDGKGSHRLQTRFHFAPDIELYRVPDHGWKLGDSGLRFLPALLADVVEQSGQFSQPFGGVFFPTYGGQDNSKTLDLSDTVNLPVSLTHALISEP
ncbi:MAG: heparinase II/III family protein [Nitrospirota bacterium]